MHISGWQPRSQFVFVCCVAISPFRTRSLPYGPLSAFSLLYIYLYLYICTFATQRGNADPARARIENLHCIRILIDVDV